MSDGNAFYGWYDDASQPVDKPTYDPPHDGPCLWCGLKLSPDNVRTYSIMMVEGYGKRSYFYRIHRSCAEKHGDKDDAVFEMIARNGD